MSYTFRDRSLSRIGVIGSGRVGSDIVLHFPKVLAPDGVSVVVVDISQEALARGRSPFESRVAKGVDSGTYRAQGAEAMTVQRYLDGRIRGPERSRSGG